ncbi:hypothetical protein WICPIJ_004981 [Wickerhamomyces pijperi]|uniref:Uncharacterized protein n=1 Tax=Wickerhamomyces pijperi TaxID=599730 RepID=A0A9P8Q4F1_WICPI|nr:hypothetical protein WICPIJ_004981 [Wickerhamomyces pijperi]
MWFHAPIFCRYLIDCGVKLLTLFEKLEGVSSWKVLTEDKLNPSMTEIFNSLAILEFFRPAVSVRPAGPPPTIRTSTNFGSIGVLVNVSAAVAKVLFSISDMLFLVAFDFGYGTRWKCGSAGCRY